MFNRSSFQPRHRNGALAGSARVAANVGVNGVPSSLIPNYAGDGYGRTTNNGSGDGLLTGVEEPLPVWSGDGRRKVINPLMPMWKAQSVDAVNQVVVDRPFPVQGDGVRGQAIELSDELVMNVNVDVADTSSNGGVIHKSPRSETWKLVALVVVFLVWISTASTLLFLYMDRYLFP
jgi:hypothetical protein